MRRSLTRAIAGMMIAASLMVSPSYAQNRRDAPPPPYSYWENRRDPPPGHEFRPRDDRGIGGTIGDSRRQIGIAMNGNCVSAGCANMGATTTITVQPPA